MKRPVVVVILAISVGVATFCPEPAGSTTHPGPAAQQTQAVLVPIKGMINDVTLYSLKRRCEREPLGQQATLIIFEIDTYGGMVTSALEISQFIKTRKARTVAWVHPKAYSAGAMIALACDEIVMSDSARLGDCAPIVPGKSMEGAERAKAESPIRAEFRDSAQRNGYSELLCEAMVRYSIEVYKIRNKKTGEVKFVDRFDAERLAGLNAPRQRNRRDGPDRQEQSQWELLKRVVGPDELLTVNTAQARELGFTKAVVDDVFQLKGLYGINELPVLKTTWSEDLAGWFNNPFDPLAAMVNGVLLLIVFVGVYTELKTPGVGLPGLAALAALVLFFLLKYSAGMAQWWNILVLAIGVGLLIVEIFVLPGFGIAGISGILMIIIGLLTMFVPSEPGPDFWPKLPATWQALRTGLTVLILTAAASLVAMWLLYRFLPKTSLGSVVVLSPPDVEHQRAPTVKPQLTEPPPHPVAETLAEAQPAGVHPPPVDVGQEGIAITQLRPAGKARFGNYRLDVVTQGELIEKGERVRVIEISGRVVTVRKIS